MPLLRDELGVSNAIGGLHGTGLAVGAVLGGLLFAPLVARLGRAKALRSGLVGLSAGIGLFTLVPALPGTLSGAFLCGLAGSIVVTGSIVVLGDRHGPAGPAAISEANAVAAGTGLVAPLLIGAGVSVGLGWRPGVVLAGVAGIVVWFVSVRAVRDPVPASPGLRAAGGPDAMVPPEAVVLPGAVAAVPEPGPAGRDPAPPGEVAGADGWTDAASVPPVPSSPADVPVGGPAPVGAGEVGAGDVGAGVAAAVRGGGDLPGRLPGAYWLAWFVIAFCVGIEFCLTFWAADNLREHTGASAAAATAGVTAVVAGMCAGRIAGGRLALLVDTRRLLLGALALCSAGFALFWVSTAPVPALVGLAVAGLGVALHYPIGAARAVAASGGRPDRAAGALSLAAGAASGSAPFALGAAADRVGTHTAFLIVPVLLVLAVTGVLASAGDARPAGT